MPTILELRHITAYRGDTEVFDDFSLSIEINQHTAILGPNGAGKSTLLKLLTREIYPLYRPESRIAVFGHERWDVWSLRRRLGIVSQDLQQEYRDDAPGLHVILSGFEASVGVWEHQRFNAAQLERARAVMNQLGIAHLAERTYGELSTGEQRRFLLGRALVHEPEALIFDEPTSGLDLAACFRYLETIRSLMRSGKTTILVTHHIHEIPPEIPRVVLLKHGRILADGDKATVLTAANLSELFATPVTLAQANGYFQAFPTAPPSAW